MLGGGKNSEPLLCFLPWVRRPRGTRGEPLPGAMPSPRVRGFCTRLASHGQDAGEHEGIFADVGEAPESVRFALTLGQPQENPKRMTQNSAL